MEIMKNSNMHIIDIPYSPTNLFIYIGNQNRKSFNSKVRFQYPEWVDDKDADAMNFQNHIFIEDITDKETLVHEAIHFLQWLFEYMQIEDEPEFQANISAHVISEIYKYQ